MDLVVLLTFALAFGPVLWPIVLPQRTPRGRRYRWATLVLFVGTVGLWAGFLYLIDPADPPAVYFSALGFAILALALCIFASSVCRQERKRQAREVEIPFQPTRPGAG
ncbi:MAG TPA: hypothetical protein VM597_35485 [Gemmataceae bacterium]|nr:hypothetical protein [Gemmataceae bacterium]